MVKKILRSFIFVLVAFVAFTSCNKTDYIAVVPANATFVASADLMSIAEKSDFGNSSLAGIMNQYMGIFIEKNAQDRVRSLMANPADMGIDFMQPVFVFKTPNQCVGITMKMNDKGDFEQFLDFLREQNLASKAVERDDVMMGTLLDDIEYGYKGKTILLIASLGEGGGPVGKQTLTTLFAQSKDDSFVNSESYEKLMGMGERDIKIYSNMAALPNELASDLKPLLPQGVRFTDVEFLASADFQNGKAVLTAQLDGANEKAKKFFEGGDTNFRNIEGRYTNMPTDDVFVWASMGVNGKWLLDKLKQDADMKQRLFLVERGIDIEAMIKAIDGDVAVTLPSSFFTSDDAESFDFMVCANVQNCKFLDDVDYWKEGMKRYGITMTPTGKNEYLLVADEYKFNWGVDGDDLYIGSNSAFASMQTSRKNGVLDARKAEIQDCKLYAYINLTVLPMQELASISGIPVFKHSLEELKAFIFKVKGNNEVEFCIELADDKDNFLKTIL